MLEVIPAEAVNAPVIVVAGVIVSSCAPVDVLNTIKSPAESIIERASAKLVGIVNIFTPVAPSKVIVLPVKLSENVDAHRVPVTPKLSVESVSETKLAPEVIPPVVVNKPVIVVAPVSVLAPVTVSVPPVLIFVLIVVAALTPTKTKKKDKTTDKTIESVLSFLKIFFIYFLNILS